ncbi:MAG TPA: tetratricopeptide repeat protein [Streptosporangiaceae bacterium]
MPQTLTDLASTEERTRFYPASRTERLSLGVAELLMDWARVKHPGGVVIAFRELDEADSTDRELVGVLVRRCDPSVVTVVAEVQDDVSGRFGQALASHTSRVGWRPLDRPPIPSDADLAQLFIDSDGTSKNPVLHRAYLDLPPDERARRHTARAEALAALDEPMLRMGAIPYHLEHGTAPASVGAEAILAAADRCFDRGFYKGAAELFRRARRLISRAELPKKHLHITNRLSACASYMQLSEDAFSYLAELRRDFTDPSAHLASSYNMAMLYTRHLPQEDHDEDKALEWANAAIVIADHYPDPRQRAFLGAFMRNARALVEMHRGNLDGARSLVNEAMGILDVDLEPHEHLLHRSVLIYNRAQLLASLGDPAAALRDYDEIIRRDPNWGDYYYERAAVRRALEQHDEALADYATAIRLSPPTYEAHFSRADLLRELGDDDGALRDLDYALVLEPDHIESLVNRADLLLARGEAERAREDIDRGLTLDPFNVHLLSACGALLADCGDNEAAYASYTAALGQDPGFVPAWANRAVLSYSAGQAAAAADDLSHAIELDDNAALRANRAVALQDLGEHQRALEDLDAAVATLGDQDPDLFYRRGASRYTLGDLDGALADWRMHLAAYDPAETSPYITEIQQRGGDLIAQARATESVA